MWRLVFTKDGAFDAEAYDLVFNRMTRLELEKANAAYDMVQRAMKEK
jgi:hypothetical protein